MQSGSFHFSYRSPRSGPEPKGLKGGKPTESNRLDDGMKNFEIFEKGECPCLASLLHTTSL
jgi:hypothetical protein